MKSDAEAFRNRARECRNLADGTKDGRMRQELRDLAKDLDEEASKIEGEQAAERNED